MTCPICDGGGDEFLCDNEKCGFHGCWHCASLECPYCGDELVKMDSDISEAETPEPSPAKDITPEALTAVEAVLAMGAVVEAMTPLLASLINLCKATGLDMESPPEPEEE